MMSKVTTPLRLLEGQVKHLERECAERIHESAHQIELLEGLPGVFAEEAAGEQSKKSCFLGNPANYYEAPCDGTCFVMGGSSDDRAIRSAPSAVQRVVNGRRYLHRRGESFPRAYDRDGYTIYEDRYFLERGFGHG